VHGRGRGGRRSPPLRARKAYRYRSNTAAKLAGLLCSAHISSRNLSPPPQITDSSQLCLIRAGCGLNRARAPVASFSPRNARTSPHTCAGRFTIEHLVRGGLSVILTIALCVPGAGSLRRGGQRVRSPPTPPFLKQTIYLPDRSFSALAFQLTENTTVHPPRLIT